MVTVENSPNFQVDLGLSCQTVYWGYAPAACTDLTANVSGGTPPYSFAWSNGDNTMTISVCPTENTPYSVVVTDANGCVTSGSTDVEVVDVRCGNKNNKVLICKVPPGNPGAAHEVCVSAAAVPAHLATGSYLGPCGYEPCEGVEALSLLDGPSLVLNEVIAGVSVSPNPVTDILNLRFPESRTNESFKVSVMNMQGQEVFVSEWQEPAAGFEVEATQHLSTGTYLLVVYWGNGDTNTERFVRQ